MIATLPQVNTLAEVDVPGEPRPLPSRIEDRAGDVITIAAPNWAGGEPVGATVTLRWSCDLGQLAVRGIVTKVLVRRLEQWVVRTDGQARIVQPRTHDRVALTLKIVVDLVDRRPPVRFSAETLDLGRGGLRLRTEEWVLPEHGEAVRLRLGEDEPPATAAGIMVRPTRVRSVLEFAVELTQPVPQRAGLLLRRLEGKAEDDLPVRARSAAPSRWWR
jgi:hypothetical protein